MTISKSLAPRVASEVARIEPRAAMDFEVVRAIADQEAAGRG